MKNILVTRSYMPPFEEYTKQIAPLWESHWLTNMGMQHEELTRKLQDYLDVPYISLICNGHMALELILSALELTGEVITTPYTFVSTTHAIVRNGLTPVFCDVKAQDGTIDETKIEALITEKTSAIVPVHTYGNICNVEEIDRIAKRYHLKVIYDAAHAFGIRYKNKGVAAFGDASIFSFHATKVFHTIEGGAVALHDTALWQKLYELKNFGIVSEDEITSIGANAKMNEFQAAMGICNLRHIEEQISLRKKIVEQYRQGLFGIKGIRCFSAQPNVKSNYAYFVIFVEDEFAFSRDELYAYLKENGVFSRKYFYPLTSELSCYCSNIKQDNTPVAHELASRVLALPLFGDLNLSDVDYICNLIKNKTRAVHR